MKKIVIAVVTLILILSLGMSAFAANSVTTTKTEDTTTEDTTKEAVWGHHHAGRNFHGVENDCRFSDADNDGICDNNHAVRGSESGHRGHRGNGHHRGMHHK